MQRSPGSRPRRPLTDVCERAYARASSATPASSVYELSRFVNTRLSPPAARAAANARTRRYKMALPFTAVLDLEAGVCAGRSLG